MIKPDSSGGKVRFIEREIEEWREKCTYDGDASLLQKEGR
jgi:predicted DNA-binding transcriptional regulator AlpA